MNSFLFSKFFPRAKMWLRNRRSIMIDFPVFAGIMLAGTLFTYQLSPFQNSFSFRKLALMEGKRMSADYIEDLPKECLIMMYDSINPLHREWTGIHLQKPPSENEVWINISQLSSK